MYTVGYGIGIPLLYLTVRGRGGSKRWPRRRTTCTRRWWTPAYRCATPQNSH